MDIKKTCTKCQETKPLSDFGKSSRAKDGLQWRCKDCLREYQAENAEKIRESKARYNAANSEKIREYNAQYRAENAEKIREYYTENAEKIREYQARWRINNPEKIREYYTENAEKLREYQAQYRAENPEKVRESRAQWRINNPVSYRDGVIRYSGEKRAREAGNPVEKGVTASALLERQEGICYLCLTPIDTSLRHPDPRSLSVDHVIPISAGGGHTWENCRASCLGCNASKGSKPLDTLALPLPAPVDVEVAA